MLPSKDCCFAGTVLYGFARADAGINRKAKKNGGFYHQSLESSELQST